MTKTQLDKVKKITDLEDVNNQVDMCIEECSELTQALLKLRRSINHKTDTPVVVALENIAEEIADVEIMIQQMKIYYGCENEVNTNITYKLNRYLQNK